MREIPVFVFVLTLSLGSALAATPAPAPVEYYENAHNVLDIDKGSQVWNELPAQERAAHEDEGGVFQPVKDILLLQARGHDRLAFCVQHIGRHLHQCQISGVAERASGNVFVYRERAVDFEDRAVECAVSLSRSATRIGVDELEQTASPDVSHDCRDYCGAHATLADGIEFETAHRRRDARVIAAAQNKNGGCPLPP